MNKIKKISLTIIYFILSLGATYLLYRLLRFEYEDLKKNEIDGFQDFMSFLLKIILDITNIFNLLAYMIVGCLWYITYNKIFELKEPLKNDAPRDKDYYSELKDDVTSKKDYLDVMDHSLNNDYTYLC